MVIPIPPREMRALVGPTDEGAFDNPTGRPIYEGLVPDRSYESVLDIGCGCGRIARQLMLQRPRPNQYVGFDPHAGMVRWCRDNLTAVSPSFRFTHQDIACPFNPGEGKKDVLPFPTETPATLVVAHSVFTHLFAHQVEYYLAEAARVLAVDGRAVTTWLLFDKRFFPFMQDEQNALYVDRVAPWAAVLFDRHWVVAAVERAALRLVAVVPPSIRGHQWTLILGRAQDNGVSVDLPDRDEAPFGIVRSEHVADPARVGLD